jgi:hypothetical protein
MLHPLYRLDAAPAGLKRVYDVRGRRSSRNNMRRLGSKCGY